MSRARHLLEVFVALLNAETGANVMCDSGGALNLLLESGRSVHIEPSPDERDLVFASPLHFLDDPRDLVMLGGALAMNLYQQETWGGAIGLDPLNEALILSWRLSVESSNSHDLVIALANFCQLADTLSRSLVEIAEASSKGDAGLLGGEFDNDPAGRDARDRMG